MKRSLAQKLSVLLLAAVLLMGCLPMAFAAEFTDVPEDATCAEAVNWAAQTGVVRGIGQDCFAPDGITTRAQAVTMLYRMAGEPAVTGENTFSDVSAGNWCEPAVIWAAEKGIVSGVGGNRFAPDRAVTREQLTTMFFRYVCAIGELNIEEDADIAIPGVDDADAVSDYAVPALHWAETCGIVLQDGQSLNPRKTCTRGETVLLLWSYEPYANPDNWAYCPADETAQADVFFVNPTVFMGQDGRAAWDSYDAQTRSAFVGAINMEKGIYDGNTRFFAPLYHQASFAAYSLPADQQEAVLAHAYLEVRDAFRYYLEHYNNGNPVILAGFSQGGDMCIRLLKDCFADETTRDLLVACYAVGWRITEEEMAANPHIRFAEGEGDTGVLIAFNSEAESVKDSLLIPEGVKTLAINPLNWKTDTTPADKTLNKGACFTDYSGAITREVPQLTGAFIDPVRGALKVPDVTPEEYPGAIFPDGVYHLYDYQFFYRNLQENVQLRLANYLAEQ